MDIIGKRLAILTWAKNQDGQDEVFAHTGTIRSDASGLHLDRENKGTVKLRPEWIARIKPVDPELRQIVLDADLVISLSVRKLSDDADLSELELTELRESVEEIES